MDRALDIDVALDRGGFRLELRQSIPARGVTAITGPSGSGKTTLLRVLAGLEPAATGRISFGGVAWLGPTGSLPPARRRLGVVFQDAPLFRHLDVAGNLAYGARRRGVSREKVAGIAAALNITSLLDRRADQLSGGERRRVGIARALASDPQLLLLDEPLSGLDAARRDATLQVIARAVEASGVPALYVSHSAEEVAALAHRVLGMEAGRATGWRAPPILLPAEARSEAGAMRLVVGDTVIPAPPGVTHEGPLSLGVAPGDLLLSASAPGESTAALCFAAELEREADGLWHLAAGGRRFSLQTPALSAKPGARVWLTLLRFWPRSPL